MAFETLFDASNATVFKFEKKGDQLEGYYMGSFDFEGDYGPTKKHVFSTSNGATVVFGQRNLIQTLPTVKAGVMLRITYTDELPAKAKGRQPMKLFKFEQDKKNIIEVTGVELTPTDSGSDDVRGDYEPIEPEVTDEAPPARPQRPTVAARTPSAAQQAEVRNALSGRAKAAKSA